MPFIEDLATSTRVERARLLAAPLIGEESAGCVTREQYLSFLIQAHCYVSRATPVAQALAEALPPRYQKVRDAVLSYGAELAARAELLETDIGTLGGKVGAVVNCPPAPEMTALITYTLEIATRGNGVGFLGLIYVAEGTVASLAAISADRIRLTLRLPRAAIAYLTRSDHAFDPERVRRLEALLNGITQPDDRAAVIRTAKAVFELNAAVLQWASQHDSSTARATYQSSATSRFAPAPFPSVLNR